MADLRSPDPGAMIPEEIANLMRPDESVIWVGAPRQTGPHAGRIWGYAAGVAAAMVVAYVLLLAAEVMPVSRRFDLWSAPLIVGLIVPTVALAVMGSEQADASRRAHTTYVLTGRHGYAYEDGIHAEPAVWPIRRGKKAPIVAAANGEWALLFDWQEHEDTNGIHTPGSGTRFCVWGQGFFNLAPDATFLALLSPIGITDIDPRRLDDPNLG